MIGNESGCACGRDKSGSKRKSFDTMALGKLLSPPRIGGKDKSSSKDNKTVVKGVKGKPRQ